MNLKFKDKMMYKVVGILWIFVGLMSIITASVFFFIDRRIAGVFLIFAIFQVPLSLMIGIYYLRLPKINYIELGADGINIHKGLVLGKSFIGYKEIKAGRVIGNKFILLNWNGNEISIVLDLLFLRDIEVLIQHCKNHFNVAEGVLDNIKKQVN